MYVKLCLRFMKEVANKYEFKEKNVKFLNSEEEIIHIF